MEVPTVAHQSTMAFSWNWSFKMSCLARLQACLYSIYIYFFHGIDPLCNLDVHHWAHPQSSHPPPPGGRTWTNNLRNQFCWNWLIFQCRYSIWHREYRNFMLVYHYYYMGIQKVHILQYHQKCLSEKSEWCFSTNY